MDQAGKARGCQGLPSPRGGRGHDLCSLEAGPGSPMMREQLGLSFPPTPPPPAPPTAGPARGCQEPRSKDPRAGEAAAGGEHVSTQRGARGVPRGTVAGGWVGCAAVLVRAGARGCIPCTRGAFPYTWANTRRPWAGAESEGDTGLGKGAEVKVKTPGPLELRGQPPGLCPEGPVPPRSSRWGTGEGSSRPFLTPWCLSRDMGGQAGWGKRRREWASSG